MDYSLSLFPSRIAFPLSGRLYSQRRYVAPTQRRVYINTSALSLSQTGDRLKENSWPISALFTQSLHTSTTRRPCSGLEKKKTLLLVFYTFWRALLLFLRNLAQCVYTLMDAKRVCHHFLAPPPLLICVCVIVRPQDETVRQTRRALQWRIRREASRAELRPCCPARKEDEDVIKTEAACLK